MKDQDTKVTCYRLLDSPSGDRKWIHWCLEVLREGWGDGRFWNEAVRFLSTTTDSQQGGPAQRQWDSRGSWSHALKCVHQVVTGNCDCHISQD